MARSSRPSAWITTSSIGWSETSTALFDAVGARRRLLIGHDWGALIAWCFAIDRRLPLDGLVIMNVPHPTVFARVLRSSWRQRLRSWYVAFFQIPGLPEAMMTTRRGRAIADAFVGMADRQEHAFRPEVTDVYRRNALVPGAMTAMINYYRANTGLAGAVWTRRASHRNPTLMIWGEEDKRRSISPAPTATRALVGDFTLERLARMSPTGCSRRRPRRSTRSSPTGWPLAGLNTGRGISIRVKAA